MHDTVHTRVRYEGNVVGFRPRGVMAFPQKRVPRPSTGDVYQLLDLSRYELRDDSRNPSPHFQPDAADDFKCRMRVNIAAMIFLVGLAGLAAADVLKLERAQLAPPAETVLARSDLS
jgi:hypothetical protein